MRKEQSFEEFKTTWLNSEKTSNLEWTAHGDNHQRDFFVFDGTQITMNTCFPYSCLKQTSVYYWVDCVMPINKETKALAKKYHFTLNDSCIYAEEQNVAIPQFKNENDMLKFMYEVDYKAMQIPVTLY